MGRIRNSKIRSRSGSVINHSVPTTLKEKSLTIQKKIFLPGNTDIEVSMYIKISTETNFSILTYSHTINSERMQSKLHCTGGMSSLYRTSVQRPHSKPNVHQEALPGPRRRASHQVKNQVNWTIRLFLGVQILSEKRSVVTWKGWERNLSIFLALATLSLSSSDSSSMPRMAMMSCSDL